MEGSEGGRERAKLTATHNADRDSRLGENFPGKPRLFTSVHQRTDIQVAPLTQTHFQPEFSIRRTYHSDETYMQHWKGRVTHGV